MENQKNLIENDKTDTNKEIEFKQEIVDEFKNNYRELFELAKLFYINGWLEINAEKREEFRYIDFCNDLDMDFFSKLVYYEIMKNRTKVISDDKNNLRYANFNAKCTECDLEKCPMKFLHYILALGKEKADQIFEIYPNKEINDEIYSENETPEEREKRKQEEEAKEEIIEEVASDDPTRLKIEQEFLQFDNVTVCLAKIILRNALIEIEKLEDGKIYFKYNDIEKNIANKGDKMEIDILLENIIRRKNIEYDNIELCNINEIKQKYNDIFKNNPYKLAAYIKYFTQVNNIETNVFFNIYDQIQMREVKRIFYLRYTIKRIDKLLITEESKENLKKMVIYASKWKGIDLPYLPFNIITYTNNIYLVSSIANILSDSLTFYGYFDGKILIETVTNLIDSKNDRNIEQVYSELGSGILVLKDFMAIDTLSAHDKNVFLQSLEEWMTEKFWDICTIIYSSDKNQLENLLSLNSRLSEMQFYCIIEEVKPEKEMIISEIIKRCKTLYNVTPEFEKKLTNYVDETYKNTRLNYNDYIQKVYEKIILNKEEQDYISEEIHIKSNDNELKQKYNNLQENVVPAYSGEKTLDQIFEEINKLVGLENVKQTLVELADLLAFKKKSINVLNLDDINLNMVFAGNPGTGKTTVARLIAEILYNLEYIKSKKVVEVDGKDLIGEYVGTTAQKTMGIVKKALGGVLFIDEAYALICANGTNSSFSEECFATLIRAMEENQNDLIIIFAGYTKEMQEFIKFNSGIVSRIGYHLEFRDYNTDELVEIFKKLAQEKGFIYTDDLIQEVRKIIEVASKKANFGNGRFVRNLFQKIVIKHASNAKCENEAETLKTLTKSDVDSTMLEKLVGTEGKKIGF